MTRPAAFGAGSNDWVYYPTNSTSYVFEGFSMEFTYQGGSFGYYYNYYPYNPSYYWPTELAVHQGIQREQDYFNGQGPLVEVRQEITLTDDRKFVEFRVNLKNVGERALSDFQYMRTVGPGHQLEPEHLQRRRLRRPPGHGFGRQQRDPGLAAAGPDTVVSVETYVQYGPRQHHRLGLRPERCFPALHPFCLVFNLGTLQPGEETTVIFYYMVGSTKNEVIDLYKPDVQSLGPRQRRRRPHRRRGIPGRVQSP